jgi:hypothetical protein
MVLYAGTLDLLPLLTAFDNNDTALDSFEDAVSCVDIPAIISQLSNDDALLRQCAALSYEHPVGFDKLILLQRSDGALIKIDYWPAERRPRRDVHNHRWSFCSKVLLGKLSIREYGIVKSSTATSIYRLSVPPDEGDEFPQMGAVECIWKGVLRPGSTYWQDHRPFHSADAVTGEICATLVAQGPPSKTYSDVISTARPVIGRTVPFQPSELRSRLERVHKLLNAPVDSADSV